jgi:transposase
VFGATTSQLEKMATWLLERRVESVALESTGVYWIAVYEVLEARGLKVLLVDSRALARVPGRPKTDRRDCQWIQRLHSCGLLQGAFRTSEQAHASAGQREFGGGASGLGAADAEELGADECAGTPGGG